MITEADILKASILIVDDQMPNVELLEALLQDAGYTNVFSTMDPLSVVALHRINHYDLILLDLKMPLMDGFEVMQGLQTITRDGYMSVIVLTAEPAHKLRALRAGAKDFISKPFDLVEVKTRIRNMLEVRLLYKKLEHHNLALEQTVLLRTRELERNADRFQRLTELASDWYWEQNDTGDFTTVSGPVLDMLGLQASAFLDQPSTDSVCGWNPEHRDVLKAKIAAREPFLDFIFSRTEANGSVRQFRISGEPMFDNACAFSGYRGIGAEVFAVQESSETAEPQEAQEALDALETAGSLGTASAVATPKLRKKPATYETAKL